MDLGDSGRNGNQTASDYCNRTSALWGLSASSRLDRQVLVADYEFLDNCNFFTYYSIATFIHYSQTKNNEDH